MQSEIVKDGSNQVGFFGRCQNHGDFSGTELEDVMKEDSLSSTSGEVCARTEVNLISTALVYVRLLLMIVKLMELSSLAIRPNLMRFSTSITGDSLNFAYNVGIQREAESGRTSQCTTANDLGGMHGCDS